MLGEGLIGVVFGLFVRVQIPIEKTSYEGGNEIVICYPDCRDKQIVLMENWSSRDFSVVMQQSIPS